MLMMDERIIAKLRRQRRRPMIELYGVECFSAMRAPSLFRVKVAHGPNISEMEACIGIKPSGMESALVGLCGSACSFYLR